MTPDSEDRNLRLNAALDGELEPMGALALERDMQADPALAAEYQQLQSLRDAVRRHASRERAPQALADRVSALAAAPLTSAAPRRRARFLLPDARALALAASFAVLGFALGAGLMTLRTQPASQEAPRALVADFARASIAGQPFDVASSDRHTVKPWLSSRTTVSASIADLAGQGFPLAGGRVSVVDRIPAPTLVYRHNEHLVAVTELPPKAAGLGAAPNFATIDGYHVARWADANLAYVAVSDMDEKTLAEFVAAFRAAQTPAQGER